MPSVLPSQVIREIPQDPTPQQRTHYGNYASIVGIICNVALALGKGIVGLASGYVSIIADAINNLSDATSSIISLIGFKLADRPADTGHPFGHGRFEYLAGLVVAVIVAAAGIELIISSGRRILNPEETDFNLVLVFMLLTSIAVKFWMQYFYKRIGTKLNSEPLKATGVDSRNDVITTAAVLLSAVISYFYHIGLDGICGLAVGIFVLYSGISLVRDTVSPLLGRAPSQEEVDHIRKVITSYPNVIGMHDLMIHDYGPGRQFGSAHVEMPSTINIMEGHDTLDNIEQYFREHEGFVVTLHLDPIVINDPAVNELRAWINDTLKTINPRLSMHDLRTVPGPTHTNVIFDIVKPYDMDMSDEELKVLISKKIVEHKPDAVCKITVDHAYASVAA